MGVYIKRKQGKMKYYCNDLVVDIFLTYRIKLNKVIISIIITIPVYIDIHFSSCCFDFKTHLKVFGKMCRKDTKCACFTSTSNLCWWKYKKIIFAALLIG